MKNIFLTAACLLLVSSPAFAAIQTFIATDKGSDTRTKLNANFTELDTGKASKTAVVRYWSDWPTTAPNNVLAVNTIVAYNGGLYKVTQELTKTGSTADPETLTAYFSEVTGASDYTLPTATDTVLGGVKVGARLSIADGVLSADVQTGEGSMVYPGAGIPVSTGSAWGTSLSATAPAFSSLSLGAASTTTGIQYFYGNTKAYPFSIFSQGADAPSIGWRLPSTMPSITSIPTIDANGYWSYLDPATFFPAWDLDYTDLINKPTLGTSAQYNVGTGANNIVQLNSSGELPFDIPGKANASCFASESAFNACFDLTWATGGYTNLTSFVTQTPWRFFYSDGSGDVKELALGSSGTVLKSNGESAVPSFQTDETAAGAGYVATPPTYSDEACTVGQYALSESYRFDCVASGNWNRTALTDWSNPTPSDTTPNAFTFGDTQTDAALSTQYCSAAVTPTGYDAAATVAATGTASSLGWKVNGGSFVTSGTLSPGQSISACGTSSSSNSTSTTASVTVGGVAATSPFTMTTIAGGGSIFDDFESYSSSNWTFLTTPTFTITSGVAYGSTQYETSVGYYNTSTGSNNHWVQADVEVATAGSSGPIIRSNGTTFYAIQLTATDIKLWSINGSTWTDTGKHWVTANTFGTLYTIKVVVSGSDFTLYKNSVQIMNTGVNTTGIVNDTTYSTGQYVGLVIDRSIGYNPRADNFSGGAN